MIKKLLKLILVFLVIVAFGWWGLTTYEKHQYRKQEEEFEACRKRNEELLREYREKVDKMSEKELKKEVIFWLKTF